MPNKNKKQQKKVNYTENIIYKVINPWSTSSDII